MTHWLGICDECRRVQEFTSQEARDRWEACHEHVEES